MKVVFKIETALQSQRNLDSCYVGFRSAETVYLANNPIILLGDGLTNSLCIPENCLQYRTKQMGFHYETSHVRGIL